jgi:hypothetical protein
MKNNTPKENITSSYDLISEFFGEDIRNQKDYIEYSISAEFAARCAKNIPKGLSAKEILKLEASGIRKVEEIIAEKLLSDDEAYEFAAHLAGELAAFSGGENISEDIKEYIEEKASECEALFEKESLSAAKKALNALTEITLRTSGGTLGEKTVALDALFFDCAKFLEDIVNR